MEQRMENRARAVERADLSAEERGMSSTFAQYRAEARRLGLGNCFTVARGRVVGAAAPEARAAAPSLRARQESELAAINRGLADLRASAPIPQSAEEFENWRARLFEGIA